MPKIQDLITVSAAAKQLGMSRQRLHQLIPEYAHILRVYRLSEEPNAPMYLSQSAVERFSKLDRPAHRTRKATKKNF